MEDSLSGSVAEVAGTLGQQPAQPRRGTCCPSEHPGMRGDEEDSLDGVSVMGNPMLDQVFEGMVTCAQIVNTLDGFRADASQPHRGRA